MKDEALTRTPRSLRDRTKCFALRVVRLYSALPESTVAQVMGKQLLRSGTSVGANYREATRGRSDAEFISKVGLALQELEESVYWMELLEESQILTAQQLSALQAEANELLAILTVCSKKTKSRRKSNPK